MKENERNRMGKIRMIKQTPGENLGLEAQRQLNFHNIPEKFSYFLTS